MPNTKGRASVSSISISRRIHGLCESMEDRDGAFGREEAPFAADVPEFASNARRPARCGRGLGGAQRERRSGGAVGVTVRRRMRAVQDRATVRGAAIGRVEGKGSCRSRIRHRRTD